MAAARWSPKARPRIVKVKRSYTGHFLKELLERRPMKKSEAAE
jgi:excinuclease ABC subunit A